MRYKILILIVIVAGVFSACNKWKKPTDVDFYVDVNKTATLNGQLTFNGGFINIEYFDFDADREKGDDVYFTNEFVSGLSIPFDGTQQVAELDFVIPQGEYKRIDIGFRTFDDNSTVCILVEGAYEYSGGGSIPFRFEFSDSEQFKIRAENDNGGNIVLNKDVISPAKIILDPNYWFEIVPVSYFENAVVSNISGTNTILIDKTNNDNIYDIVLDRLEETALIVFNY
ncbi:MAG: hypothetical protein ACJASQ_003309 [Crocinitomicaceae bacterium]|jgi:hypothetical protein